MHFSLYGLFRDASSERTGSGAKLFAPDRPAVDAFIKRNSYYRKYTVVDLGFDRGFETYVDYVIDSDGNVVLPHYKPGE